MAEEYIERFEKFYNFLQQTSGSKNRLQQILFGIEIDKTNNISLEKFAVYQSLIYEGKY